MRGNFVLLDSSFSPAVVLIKTKWRIYCSPWGVSEFYFEVRESISILVVFTLKTIYALKKVSTHLRKFTDFLQNSSHLLSSSFFYLFCFLSLYFFLHSLSRLATVSVALQWVNNIGLFCCCRIFEGDEQCV